MVTAVTGSSSEKDAGRSTETSTPRGRLAMRVSAGQGGAACRDRTDDLPLTRSTVARAQLSATGRRAREHLARMRMDGGVPS